MHEILVEILLSLLIIVCLLLIANLARLYQTLTNASEITGSIRKTVNSILTTIASWKESAKTVGEVVSEVTNYVNAFKKMRNNSEEDKKEKGE